MTDSCVDYLSHNFSPQDLHSCWRNATKHKDSIANGRRLENASWRRFFQLHFHLKTIDPAQLNWKRDSDVTWLYGPFFSFEPLEQLQSRYANTPSLPVRPRRTFSDLYPIAFIQTRVPDVDQKPPKKQNIKPSKSFPALSRLVKQDTLMKKVPSSSALSRKTARFFQSTSIPNRSHQRVRILEDIYQSDYLEEDKKTGISLFVVPKGVDKDRWVSNIMSPDSKPRVQISISSVGSSNSDQYVLASEPETFLSATNMYVGDLSVVIPKAPAEPPPKPVHPPELEGATPDQLDAYYQQLYHNEQESQEERGYGIKDRFMDAVTSAAEVVSWAKDILYRGIQLV